MRVWHQNTSFCAQILKSPNFLVHVYLLSCWVWYSRISTHDKSFAVDYSPDESFIREEFYQNGYHSMENKIPHPIQSFRSSIKILRRMWLRETRISCYHYLSERQREMKVYYWDTTYGLSFYYSFHRSVENFTNIRAGNTCLLILSCLYLD